MRKALILVIFNYGISLEYSKMDHECNPNKKEYSSDGSIKKYKLTKSWCKYSNPYFAFHFLWNYTALLRLHLDRE